MASAALHRRLTALQADLARLKAPTNPTLARLRTNPTRILSDAGFIPDPWQAELLTEPASRTLLCCSRQSGKSQTVAGLALLTALTEPGSLILLLSPTMRQSGELFRKLANLWQCLGRPLAHPRKRENATRLELVNGSRIESLPGSESTVRSFSAVRLLVIDEAARTADELYAAVRPMLAVSHGKLVALSTPFGKRGWFYESWENGRDWKRVRITAEQCPRITPEFLEEERLALGDLWWRQEYEVVFGDVVSSLFRTEDVQATLNQSMEPFVCQPQAESKTGDKVEWQM